MLEPVPHEIWIPTCDSANWQRYYYRCDICHVFFFRTHDSKVMHAHRVVCSAVRAMYFKVVVEANKNRVRGQERTLIDAEVARMEVEMGLCSAAWVNPNFIKPEDRVYLNPEQLTFPARREIK